MSVDLSNMGVLCARSGDLREAENLFKQSLVFAERINDQIYVSLWNVVLTTVLQDQGKFSEAEACLYRAINISRAMKNTPCIGFALVALGNLHIAQSIMMRIQYENASQEDDELPQRNLIAHSRFLIRAQSVLERALALEELEAETKIEGQLILARVFLFLGNLDKARHQAISTLDEARQHELVWEPARAQSLLGSILAAKGQQEQAKHILNEPYKFFATMVCAWSMLVLYIVMVLLYWKTILLKKRTINWGKVTYVKLARSLMNVMQHWICCELSVILRFMGIKRDDKIDN